MFYIKACHFLLLPLMGAYILARDLRNYITGNQKAEPFQNTFGVYICVLLSQWTSIPAAKSLSSTQFAKKESNAQESSIYYILPSGGC